MNVIRVTVKLLNVVSTIHGVNSRHEQELDNLLSYFTEGYFFSPMYRRGMWDGKKHLYKRTTAAHPYGKFPTGLISRVLKIFDEYFPEDAVDIEDLRDRPHQEHPLMTPGYELHDYEQETVNLAIQTTRGLFRLPTGAGKSVIEAAVIARLNLPTLIMSHRQEILFHLKAVAEKAMGFEIGILGAGQKKLMKFNAATVQTIQSCLKYAATNKQSNQVVEFLQKQCRCLIIDEAHHASSDSYMLLANRAYNAFYRFGFCLSGMNSVTLADGTEMRIKQVVEKKLPVEVISYNQQTNLLEPKKIKNWYRRKVVEPYLIQITIPASNRKGSRVLTCTPDHEVFVKDKGWTRAEEIVAGDKIVSVRATLSGEDNNAKKLAVRHKISEKRKGWKPSVEWRRLKSLSLLGNIPWNKGLTKETDSRVLLNAEHRNSTMEKNFQRGDKEGYFYGNSLERNAISYFAEHGLVDGADYLKQVKIENFRVDFYFPRANTILEVDGCRWHACDCYSKPPHPKVKAIDAYKERVWGRAGYNVFRARECHLPEDLDRFLVQYVKA